MIAYRSRGLQTLHCGVQIFTAAALFWTLILTVFHGSISAYDHYAFYTVCIPLGLLVEFLRSDVKRANILDLDSFGRAKLAVRQTWSVFIVLMLLVVGLKDQNISRLFLTAFFPCLYACLFGLNVFAPAVLARRVFYGRHKQNTLLYGASARIEKLQAWLAKRRIVGLHPVGVVASDRAVGTIASLPILGSPEALEQTLETSEASQLILAEKPGNADRFREIIDVCDRVGVRLLVIEDLAETFGQKVKVIDDNGLQLISTYNEPLESPANRLIKRIVDIALALPVVVLILPWTSLVVWTLHRFQSPGPLIFCQKRTGAGGRQFRIFKYRTMAVENPDESRQATANDQRVFPAGRLLRKLSIDELPQFWNVLKGEMSVVGPRPHLQQHDEVFRQAMRSYHRRHFIKPGITGLAQVRDFRGETKSAQDVVNRVKCDLHYIENWSFLMDGWIVLRTALKMIVPPKTSY